MTGTKKTHQIAWRTLRDRIQKLQESRAGVLQRDVVGSFVKERATTKEEILTVRDEVLDTLDQMERSGKLKKSLGQLESGFGLVIWLTESGDGSTTDPNFESNQGGIQNGRDIR